MQLYAPAKINLSLEIKGRREDGFHEIETLMAPISLSDRLTIERGRDHGRHPIFLRRCLVVERRRKSGRPGRQAFPKGDEDRKRS